MANYSRRVLIPYWNKGALKRMIQIGACVLAITFQAALCSAECVVVEPDGPLGLPVVIPSRFLPYDSALIPFLSSRVLKLALVDDGKPIAGAKVEFYSIGSGARAEKLAATLVSDEFGLIKSPKLPDGHYEIVGTADRSLRTALLLDISSHHGKRATALKMDLRPVNASYVAPKFVAPQPLRFQQVAIEDHLEVFRGTILDQTGAVIPGASIRIFRQGTESAGLVQELKSGQSGEFETKLDPGTYVAQFSSPGFAAKLLGFEIGDLGSEQLIVTLKIGAIC